MVDQALDDANLRRSEANWHAAYKIIGLDDYPIFDEAYRQTLNDKIIRHYWMREIGGETVALFRFFLRRAMHEIMPYYNQMYESLALADQIRPLVDHTRTTAEDATGRASNQASTNATSASTGQDLFNDTPMSALNIDNVKSGKYLSTADFTEATTTDNGRSDSSGTYDNTLSRTETGHDKPESELLLLWRSTFVNIDLEIIESEAVSSCFMGLW
ncbi:MAG: hypothetical protein [Bacteriophage sp.]|nr:MAG: hypothetical protein [Bacteriophage sp.]